MELTIKELKSGLSLGQMQVTQTAERVGRSVALSVLAYLLLVRLYGRDAALTKAWSLFRRKEHFIGEGAQEARTLLKGNGIATSNNSSKLHHKLVMTRHF